MHCLLPHRRACFPEAQAAWQSAAPPVHSAQPTGAAAEFGMVIRTSNVPPSKAQLGLPKDGARLGVSGSGTTVPLDATSTTCSAGASSGTVRCASGFPTLQN